MTIRSHLDPSVLISYAAGTLPGALSCVVACHLSMCPKCAEDVRRLEMLGGLMLDAMPQEFGGDGLQKSAEEIISGELTAPGEPERSTKPISDPILPEPLARYLGMTLAEIPWKSLPKGIKQYWVTLPIGAGLIRLLKVPPHLKLLEHSHRGTELTMVLAGTYSDYTGDYFRGDVTEMNEGMDHRPASTADEECICIVASEAPPHYTRLYARLLRPILGY